MRMGNLRCACVRWHQVVHPKHDYTVRMHARVRIWDEVKVGHKAGIGSWMGNHSLMITSYHIIISGLGSKTNDFHPQYVIILASFYPTLDLRLIVAERFLHTEGESEREREEKGSETEKGTNLSRRPWRDSIASSSLKPEAGKKEWKVNS